MATPKSEDLRMPTSMQFVIMLIEDKLRLSTFRLMDTIVPMAVEAAQQEIAYIDREINFQTEEFGKIDINTSSYIPSFHAMQAFIQANELGSILYDEIKCVFKGHEYRKVPTELKNFGLDEVTAVSLIGCYHTQPFVKLSAQKSAERLVIDFRGLNDFEDT